MSTIQTSEMNQLMTHVGRLAVDASAARKPEVLSLQGWPGHVAPIFHPATGQVVPITAPVGPRRYLAGDVADLARMVDEFAGRDQVGLNRLLFVFVYCGDVHVVLDELGDRRESITLKLDAAEGCVNLEAGNGKWFDQEDMIEFLRTAVNGVYSPTGLVETLRDLSWKGTSDGTSVVRTGKASLGKQVQLSVDVKSGSLPDDVLITLPVYDDFLGDDGRPVNVTLAASFDVNVEKREFRVKVKAGEFARGKLEVDTLLQQRLAALIKNEKQNVRIFRGVPG